MAFEPRASGCTPATVHEGFVVTENCQEDTEPFAFLNCKPSIRQTAVSRPAPHSSQRQLRALRPRARPEHLLVVPPGPRTCRRRLDRAGAGAAGPWRPRAPPPASPAPRPPPGGIFLFPEASTWPLSDVLISVESQGLSGFLFLLQSLLVRYIFLETHLFSLSFQMYWN